jgi:hypothetical protein
MSDERIVEQIVKKHGEVLNLRENPGVIIDILRRFGPAMDHDDGGLPGGVPPSPPGPWSRPFDSEPGTGGGTDGGTGPTGPSSRGFDGPGLDAVLKEVLRLSKSVDELHAKIDRGQVGA